MRRALFACMLLALCGSRLAAQAMQPTVPSPTAASLGKFGDIPISFYTGTPEISVPLFTAKGKTIDLPISLAYHASGVKVEEMGSWVGIGWALEAGGVITRTVRGIVDEKAEGYFNTGHAFYEPSNWMTPPPQTLLLNIHHETQDGEPDQFFFNFAGQSGEFVGGPTTAVESDPIVFSTIPYRKWRIERFLGADPIYASHGIVSWKITTEDGTQYKFDALEVQRNETSQWPSLPGGRAYQPYMSSWYLTEIRSPGGDVITLEYERYMAEHHTGLYREETNDRYEANAGDCGQPGYQVGSSFIFDLHSESTIHAQRLKTIRTAAHTITFAHSLRADAVSPAGTQQEPRLDEMTVATPAGVVLRRFQFEYDYSLGGRLTLLNVYEADAAGNRLPPFSFAYSGPTLPIRPTNKQQWHDGTASFALDHWGYFNGRTSNTTLIPPGRSPYGNQNSYPGADRNPDFNFMKAGALIRITYPTGGFNEFVYAANDYSSVSNRGGGPAQNEQIVHQNASLSSNPGELGEKTKDFTIGGLDPTVTGRVSVFVDTPCSQSPCPYAELWSGGGKITGWFATTNPETQETFQLTRGTTYTIKTSNLDRPVRVAITMSWQERVLVTEAPFTKLGAGLRIAELRTSDAMGNVMIRKYSYLESDGVRSSGVIGFEPKYDYARNSIGLGTQCVYYSRASQSKIPLGGGPVIGYKAVTETFGAGGEFGKTRRTFFAGGDFPMHTTWPFLRYTSNAWRRGHQATTEEFNTANQRQRESLLLYTFPTWAQTTKTFRGIAIDVYSMSFKSGAGGGAAYFIESNRFEVVSGLKLQNFQFATFYDEAGANSMTSSKQFVHGNPNHAQLTESIETNSDGTERVTRLKYPADYGTGTADPAAAALTAMQGSAHMHSAVVERSVFSRSAGVERVVESEITTFKEFLAGQFLPWRRYVLNSPSPLP